MGAARVRMGFATLLGLLATQAPALAAFEAAQVRATQLGTLMCMPLHMFSAEGKLLLLELRTKLYCTLSCKSSASQASCSSCSTRQLAPSQRLWKPCPLVVPSRHCSWMPLSWSGVCLGTLLLWLGWV